MADDLRTRRRSIGRGLAIALAVSGCGTSKPAVTGLDPAAMPAEAAGLIPGVSTEADVAKAWPAATITRDRRFGGDGMAAYNGEPAVWIEEEPERREARLVEIGGAPRVVVLKMPITRDCASVLAGLASRGRPRPCHNRSPNPGEHVLCSAIPDGTRLLEFSCYDRSLFEFHVDVELGDYAL